MIQITTLYPKNNEKKNIQALMQVSILRKLTEKKHISFIVLPSFDEMIIQRRNNNVIDERLKKQYIITEKNIKK